MSPCERYVLTYAPANKNAYVVWNFQSVDKIREFEKEQGEDQLTYQWSYDGNYVAKKFKLTKETEEGQKEKTGVSVYELPSMHLLENAKKQKKSITIHGVQAFEWAPHDNFFVYTAFQEGQVPKIGFIEIPTRRELTSKAMPGTESLDITFHPQGHFLALVNQRKAKKQIKWQIEVFNTRSKNLPHQIIPIQQEVHLFQGIYWEPHHNKLAIMAKVRRQLEAGQKDYTKEKTKHQIMIFRMDLDEYQNFRIKNYGQVPSEKAKGFCWAGSGDIFAVIEQESNQVVNFFMIQEEEPISETVQATGGKTKGQAASRLVAAEVKYEFKKTARQEIRELKFDFCWDQSGRYFTAFGIKNTSIDSKPKSIKMFNLVGEPVLSIEGVNGLKTF